ncbi:unnamed protein product [Cunninghamella blakesleeana]
MKLLNLKDVDEFHQLIEENQDNLRPWLGWVDKNVEDKSNIEQFIKGSLERFYSNSGIPNTFAILYQQQLAGVISYNDFNTANHFVTIGYWLAKNYQGRGVMTKVVRTLIDMAFNDYSMNRVEIRAAPENKKSRAVPERLGFTQEGILRQAEWVNDRYLDHVVYSLLKSDVKNE